MSRQKNSILNRQTHCILHVFMPLLLLASGCSLSLFPGYHRQPDCALSGPVSWFRADSGHFLFNTEIDVFKKHFGGIMVVKPFENGSYRVVFITEVGLKIFDMEFLPDSLVKVNYIMEAMNKKALVNTLSNDIGLVLMNGLPSAGTPIILGRRKSDDAIFKYHLKKSKVLYFLHNTGNKPYFVKQTGCITNKVKADLDGNNNTGIDSVKIKHYNLRLSINLYRINE
jgi:hypothetical protein